MGRSDLNRSSDGGSALLQLDVKQACTVLYSGMPALDALRTETILSRLVGPCRVEWARTDGSAVPMVGGVARWGEHEVAMLALNAPVRAEVLARTVGVSPMPDEQRARLMDHQAAIRLLYLKGPDRPVEQLTALYGVATALLSQGGLGILNERAALAQPAELLVEYLPLEPGETPPMILWVGVVTFDLADDEPHERYLMRTYGMEQFGLPDLGTYVADRSTADAVYHLLLNLCLYLVEAGPGLQIGSGHRADFNGSTYLFTATDEAGATFNSLHGLLVLVEV